MALFLEILRQVSFSFFHLDVSFVFSVIALLNVALRQIIMEKNRRVVRMYDGKDGRGGERGGGTN